MMQKPGTPGSMPSKSVIFTWIKQIVPQSSTKMKVQDLGDGVVYCRIMNHYFPGCINLNRLNSHPKTEYDFSLNLKMFQNALTVHKITLPFDVGKIAKQKFLQNWGLINSLYRNLSANNEQSVVADDSKSVSLVGSKFTPKRSFELAFSNEQIHKLPEYQNFVKPVYSHPRQPTIHYQNNITIPTPAQNPQPSPIVAQNQIITQQNALTHQSPIHHSINQQSGASSGASNGAVNGGNTIYHLATLNQSAFGGFNFGMTNNSNTLNFNTNQNLLFNRPQPILNRESISSQLNRNSPFEQPIANKCWSVGKLPTREALGVYGAPSQENSGKYSVNSHIFQNNYNAVIDRVKEILLKNSHDIEKIRQIKILLNIPLNEDIVKIEEQQNVMINCTNLRKNSIEKPAEKQTTNVELKICTKQTIEGSKENIAFPESKSSIQLSNGPQKVNPTSKSISNSGSITQNQIRKQRITNSSSKAPLGSGKKIKNNFFGEGSVFRK